MTPTDELKKAAEAYCDDHVPFFRDSMRTSEDVASKAFLAGARYGRAEVLALIKYDQRLVKSIEAELKRER